jgi:hypothetical protein
MDIAKMNRKQRDDLIDQLHQARRQVESDIQTAKQLLAQMQDMLDERQARLTDIEHSLGHLK